MNYLYVCHFSNGHIKVGRSVDPLSRIAAHEARVSCLGVELVASNTFPCVAGSVGPEASLIERCREHAKANHKNEWFTGLNFDEVCKWAREFSLTASDAGPAYHEGAVLKKDAIALLGSVGDAAAAIGINPQAISQWPDVLPPRLQDRVIAALVRLGRPIPEWASKPAAKQEA